MLSRAATQVRVTQLAAGAHSGLTDRCTLFDQYAGILKDGGKRLAAWDRWIMTHQPSGIVHVDIGAAAALRKEKSLLAKGVVGVTGIFSAGDIVEIAESGSGVLGRGKIKFSSEEMNKIKGLASAQIPAALQREKSPECVIHKDDLVMF